MGSKFCSALLSVSEKNVLEILMRTPNVLEECNEEAQTRYNEHGYLNQARSPSPSDGEC